MRLGAAAIASCRAGFLPSCVQALRACPGCLPSANSSTILAQKAGRSFGVRLVTSPWSVTTFLVDPGAAGILDVRPDTRERRQLAPLHHVGLDQNPRAVTNHADRLLARRMRGRTLRRPCWCAACLPRRSRPAPPGRRSPWPIAQVLTLHEKEDHNDKNNSEGCQRRYDWREDGLGDGEGRHLLLRQAHEEWFLLWRRGVALRRRRGPAALRVASARSPAAQVGAAPAGPRHDAVPCACAPRDLRPDTAGRPCCGSPPRRAPQQHVQPPVAEAMALMREIA